MGTLQQQIAAKFLARLADSNQIDTEKLGQLRKLLTDGKRPKAEDFVKIFTLPAGEDIK